MRSAWDTGLATHTIYNVKQLFNDKEKTFL